MKRFSWVAVSALALALVLPSTASAIDFGVYGSLYDSFHDLPRIETLVYADDTTDVILRTREEFRKQLRSMIQEHIARGSIDLKRVRMPVSRLVDLIRLTPQALKRTSTTRERLRPSLGAPDPLRREPGSPTPDWRTA